MAGGGGPGAEAEAAREVRGFDGRLPLNPPSDQLGQKASRAANGALLRVPAEVLISMTLWPLVEIGAQQRLMIRMEAA